MKKEPTILTILKVLTFLSAGGFRNSDLIKKEYGGLFYPVSASGVPTYHPVCSSSDEGKRTSVKPDAAGRTARDLEYFPRYERLEDHRK